MKKIFLLIVLSFCLAFTASAQGSEMEMIKELFKMEKKIALNEFLSLNDEQGAAFWPVYDAYEAERGELGKTRIKLLQAYAEKYETLSEEDAATWVKEVFTLQKKHLSLQKKYFGKVKKAVGAKTATTFWQFEEYVQTAIKMEILDAIPFVGK